MSPILNQKEALPPSPVPLSSLLCKNVQLASELFPMTWYFFSYKGTMHLPHTPSADEQAKYRLLPSPFQDSSINSS